MFSWSNSYLNIKITFSLLFIILQIMISSGLECTNIRLLNVLLGHFNKSWHFYRECNKGDNPRPWPRSWLHPPAGYSIGWYMKTWVIRRADQGIQSGSTLDSFCKCKWHRINSLPQHSGCLSMNLMVFLTNLWISCSLFMLSLIMWPINPT